MRIRLGTLRRLIREVKLSPSVKQNNHMLDGPLEDKMVAKAVGDLEHTLQQALLMDLVLANFDDHYDAQSREFDDAEYERVKGVSERVSQSVKSRVDQLLDDAWSEAHAPASGVRQRAAA